MDNTQINLVPKYHAEMLQNALKSQQNHLYSLLQIGLRECMDELDQIKSKNIAVCFIYFISQQWGINQPLIVNLNTQLHKKEPLNDAEQFGLLQICAQCINDDAIECEPKLDLILLLRINYYEGFYQLSPQIHNYLRQCKHPKVSSLYIELYMKQHFELLAQMDAAYEEDFVWTLPSIEGFYEKLPQIEHPYYGIVLISAYVRTLEFSQLPCPIEPRLFNLHYEGKILHIYQQLALMKNKNQKFKDCYELVKRKVNSQNLGCLLQANAFNILMQVEELSEEDLIEIKDLFMKSVVESNKAISQSQLSVFKQLKIDDIEFKRKAFSDYIHLFDESTVDQYRDEQLFTLLIQKFDQLEKKEEIIKSLLSYKDAQLLRVVLMIHIENAEVNFNCSSIGDSSQFFNINQFKKCNHFQHLTYEDNYSYLIQALLLTGIVIYSNDQTIKLTIEDVEKKNLIIAIQRVFEQQLTINQQLYLLNLLLNLSCRYQYQEYERRIFYDENSSKYKELIQDLPNSIHLKIQIPYFLEIIIILIFESNCVISIKKFFLSILSNMVYNLENVLILERSQLIDKLILYLRIETELQNLLIEILTHCMKFKFSLSYLQAVTYYMSPYASILLTPFIEDAQRQQSYTKIARLLGVPKKAIRCTSQEQYFKYQQLINSNDLFINNLNLLLDCLGKVVLNQNDSYYYFLGRESSIQIEGKNILEINNEFSLVMHLSFKLQSQQYLLHFTNQECELIIMLEEELNQIYLVFKYRKGQLVRITRYFIAERDIFLIINYKNSFTVNANGQELQPLSNDIFESINMSIWNQMAIGSSVNGKQNLTGAIKFLFIIDQAQDGSDLYETYMIRCMGNGSMFSQLLKMQIPAETKIVGQLNTQYLKENRMQGAQNNLIQTIETDWLDMTEKRDSYYVIRSSKKKQSALDKLVKIFSKDRKSQNLQSLQTDPLTIQAKNVLLIESTTLVDAIKIYGNLDVLYFPLHILSNCDETIYKLLQLLGTIIDKYGDDNQIQNYLRSDSEYKGLQVFGYSITAYLKNNNCSIDLANAIINFYLKFIRPQCQLIQVVRNEAFSIFYNFEFWQYCNYGVLQLVYGRLFEQLEKDDIVLDYFINNQLMDRLFYIMSVQLAKWEAQKGELKTFLGVRAFILKCIIHIMYSPFFTITHGALFPDQMILKKQQSSDKLFELKNQIITLLSHLTLTSLYDFLKLLNFCVKKPQNTLILELMNEERKKLQLAKDNNNKMIDVLQAQFGLSLRNDTEDQAILNKIFTTIYGVITEIIVKHNQKQFDFQIPEVTGNVFDIFMGQLTEILVKVQVIFINFESAFIQQQQNKQAQSILKVKESQIIKQLLQNLTNLYQPSLQISVKTYQVIINLVATIFKKNLSMEKEILDFFVPRFRYMDLSSKEIIIEFFLQCSNKQQQFMFQLCQHQDILDFIKTLVISSDKQNEQLKSIGEKGQTLTNYIIKYHIENVKFSARKILRFFHYVNSFQIQNDMFMRVIVTILILQNTQSKSLPALIDLFLILPAAIKLYPDMIRDEPELFVKLFNEYLIYLEKQQVLYQFCPDTEYVGFYQYDSVELTQKLFSEYQNKQLVQNGNILATALYILFNALEILINTKEAKKLLYIWRRIIQNKETYDNKSKYEGLQMIEKKEIQGIQTKQRKMKIKIQKRSFMQKITSLFDQQSANQYTKFYSDIHLMHVLKFQMLAHQNSDALYEIFSLIKFQIDNYLAFQCLYPFIDKFNENQFKYTIQPNMTIEDIESLSNALVQKFNTQNVLVKDAIASNQKPNDQFSLFMHKILQATTPLKYLELFKDTDTIKKAIIYIRAYSYRQIQFCQDLNIFVVLRELTDKVRDMIQLSIDCDSVKSRTTQFEMIPDFALNSLYLFNLQRLEFREILKKYEHEQMIAQLIIKYKVKNHFKANTDKRGLWYFMNIGDTHLYEKLNNFSQDYESLIELINNQKYQINSHEDKLRRRMFLKVFAKHKRNYESICLQQTTMQVFAEFYENSINLLSTIKQFFDQKKIPRQSIEVSIQNDYVKMYIKAELITQRVFYKGKIRITQDYLMFENFGESQVNEEAQYKFQKDRLSTEEKQKLIPLSKIKEVFPRGYLLQQTAIEIFTINNKTYLFNVFNQQQAIMKLLSSHPSIKVITQPSETFRKSQFIDKWKKGEISNFQYIMEINKYSGRTFNDLNQYPIFPWVIANYKDFEIKNEEDYRRLDQPIGALNQKRLENFLERFKQSDPEDANMYFIYGTHYSHSAIVISFLMRMEPFATLHLELQSGRFDRADRLFHSVEQQWYSVMNSSSDVKELIPEWFYFPEFLKNKNKFDLGQLQSGTVVSDVSLPEFCSTQTPEELIFLNQLAMESEFVNQNLNNWIDLIFGYKSGTHEVAIKSNNLYHKLTYAHNLQQLMAQATDDIIREQYITQVYYYGQTPLPLFRKEHPQRQFKGLDSPILVFNLINTIFKIDKPIIKLLQNEKYLVAISQDSEVHVLDLKQFKLKELFQQEIRSISLNLGENLYNKFLITDEQLIVAGFTDNALRLFNLKDLKVQYSLVFHNKIITAIAANETLLLCGSMDTRISAWEWTNDGLKHQPSFILYGHKKQVCNLSVNETLDIIVSMDIIGNLLIHSLKGEFIKLIEICYDIQDIVIHPLGYLIMYKADNLLIYTLNGDLFAKRQFLENICGIDVISNHHQELLITTEEGQIVISSLFLLKQFEDSSKSIRKKYKLDEFEIKTELGIRKTKESKNLDIINNKFSCTQLLKSQKLLLIGLQNGQIISLYDKASNI